ncbi:heterokaryon incompatibility protein-domain-containing protein [Bisporella sp. PMI_857]|nr:heterokaryon incompatibility protein-domain-containing protein [Bisporella sp. PMI_857]
MLYHLPDRVLIVQNQPDEGHRELLVTKNYAEAPGAIRKHDGVDNIWIDAISINQADLQERNSQVSMMGGIYMGAFAVRVWLGHETDDSGDAIRALLALWGTQKDSINNDLRQAIVNTGNRPYWQRMWTLQEIALAKLVLLHVGDKRMHYFTLAEGAGRTGEDTDHMMVGTHFLMSARTRYETGDRSLAHLLAALLFAQTKDASGSKR